MSSVLGFEVLLRGGMISAFQWPVSLEAKWRALYGSLLLGLLPVCGSPCIWGGWISFKGVVITWFGLCLGIVHVPGSSAGRRGSWRCTVVLLRSDRISHYLSRRLSMCDLGISVLAPV